MLVCNRHKWSELLMDLQRRDWLQMNATKELIDQALGNYNSMRRFEEERKTNFPPLYILLQNCLLKKAKFHLHGIIVHQLHCIHNKIFMRLWCQNCNWLHQNPLLHFKWEFNNDWIFIGVWFLSCEPSGHTFWYIHIGNPVRNNLIFFVTKIWWNIRECSKVGVMRWIGWMVLTVKVD